MAELDINDIIRDFIENCPDPEVKKLIKKSIMYEIDTWNRQPVKKEVIKNYTNILNKII